MAKLQTQLSNAAEIKNILQKVNVTYTWNGSPVDVHLMYLPCINGTCDVSSFFQVIKKGLMANFVFSHEHIMKKLDLQNSDTNEELFKRAVKYLSKKTAHGELGELILFTLIDVYLGAPKILSKVSQKTSRKMPVYGADAVHAQYVDGSLRLYLGESKLHKSFKSAATKATKSISNALNNYEHEFNLIETHINFPEIDRNTEKEIISILNPFNSTTIETDILHSPCFIGFAEPSCFVDENKYHDTYVEIAKRYIADFFSKSVNNGIHRNKITLMMLPFSSVTHVVKDFIDYMEIEA